VLVAFTSISFSVLSGILKPGEALSGFGNNTIWLIVSAFLFAKGFIKTGLGRRIAYMVMRSIGDSTLKLGYALAISDLIIAPATPSNTARAGGVLFPIVRSLCSAFDSEPGPTARRVGAFMTSCAPNPLMVVLAAQTLNIQLDWGSWATAAIVPGAISLALVPYILYKIYPPELKHTPEAKYIAARELVQMGPMTYG